MSVFLPFYCLGVNAVRRLLLLSRQPRRSLAFSCNRQAALRQSRNHTRNCPSASYYLSFQFGARSTCCRNRARSTESARSGGIQWPSQIDAERLPCESAIECIPLHLGLAAKMEMDSGMNERMNQRLNCCFPRLSETLHRKWSHSLRE